MQKNLAALVFVILAVALFSVTVLLAKWLGGGQSGTALHPLFITGFRFVFGLSVASLLFLYAGRPSAVVPIKWHLLRTASGWFGVAMMFSASIVMPLADANSVTFLSVVVAMLLSAAVFSEKISLLRWFAVALALLGALLIARPGSTLFNPMIGLAFMAALFIGIETVLIKFLSDQEKPMRILWFNNLIGAAISVPVIATLWIAPSAAQWFALFGVGALMVFTQLLNILAMRRAGVSFVAPFWLLAPFFAAAYDLFIFDTAPSVLTTAGMLLILIGGLLVYRSR